MSRKRKQHFPFHEISKVKLTIWLHCNYHALLLKVTEVATMSGQCASITLFNVMNFGVSPCGKWIGFACRAEMQAHEKGRNNEREGGHEGESNQNTTNQPNKRMRSRIFGFPGKRIARGRNSLMRHRHKKHCNSATCIRCFRHIRARDATILEILCKCRRYAIALFKDTTPGTQPRQHHVNP